ncbi:MAG: HipA domain-containing protein [Planctomycetes bacterium]|nr:HipA domain-containing protein [Planctomycetota bacterium]
MTSNTECYVYIVLPGETEFVTAGKIALALDRRSGETIGRFVYGQSYLKRDRAVPIDPIELQLGRTTYETGQNHGLFSALRDAGPDYWGRRVIERHVRQTPLGELDYLINSPDDRAGALGFGLGREPPAPLKKFNQTLDLATLQSLADSILADEDLQAGTAAEQAQELLLIGTSMGGARPKTVVEDEHGLWIAKFNLATDPWNYARVEHAMLLLGRECGLSTSESKIATIGGRDVLLVKRFDRAKSDQGYRRARMLSALTLLRASESAVARDRWSYVLLSEELRRISSKPSADAAELFRRMTFNALISNIDDHPRNHAVIATNDAWRLSPAYDLVPSMPVSLERRDLALECGNEGRYANANNLLSQCRRFLLERPGAEQIINEMEHIVRVRWRAIARAQGVTDRDCDRIAQAFVYPGFRL